MQRIPLLTPARWSLDNAAFEVLQRIESVTPNDATLLEGNDGRAEKHVAEEKRAERMRERIERRNTHADVYAGVEAERDDKGGYGENTSPTLAEENAKDWRHVRSEEHTSELQSHSDLVCRLLLEKKKQKHKLNKRKEKTKS